MSKWEEYAAIAVEHVESASHLSPTSPIHVSLLAKAQVYATLALVEKTPAPRPARAPKKAPDGD